jgi:hypothetical protein
MECHPSIRIGRVYANFPDPELSDQARAYYGSNLDRLHVVKRRRAARVREGSVNLQHGATLDR